MSRFDPTGDACQAGVLADEPGHHLDNCGWIGVRYANREECAAMRDCGLSSLPLCRRRAMLAAAMALAPWASFPAWGQDQADDPTSAPPQTGDRLILLAGPKKGQ